VVRVTRGPRQELVEDRRLGPAGAELLYRAVRSVAVARGFPPPEGHSRWDDGAVQDVAHEFLDGERGQRRLSAIILASTDEESFEALLNTAVLNVHRDRGRRTDFGALVLRVTEILSDEPQFRRDRTDPARWTLAAGRDGASSAPPTALERAAEAVHDVQVPRWSSAVRRAPLADRATFVRLLTAILTAADGSATPADLARACERRLDGRAAPLAVEVDVLEFLGADPTAAPTEDDALNGIVALQVFDALSERERLLLATFSLPVRSAAAKVGVGHSQTAVLRRRLVDHLRSELADDPDSEDVFGVLLGLAEQWAVVRTDGRGATF
jgi:uncharacterized protein YigA (DUF484 family)